MDEIRVTRSGRNLSPGAPIQTSSDTVSLSEAELEILRLSARWMTHQEIAHELTYSTHRVQAHLARILSKLQVRSQTEAVLYAMKKGWLP
jgi:DNA-binding NarL/FixJ family response regulator